MLCGELLAHASSRRQLFDEKIGIWHSIWCYPAGGVIQPFVGDGVTVRSAPRDGVDDDRR